MAQPDLVLAHRSLWTVAAGLWRCLRPRQWVKNGFVLAPLIFSGRLLQPDVTARALLATVIFCGLSGVTYLVNDILDMHRDRLHPRKRHRPLAAGIVAPAEAAATAALMATALLWAAAELGLYFAVAAWAYAGLMLAYTLWLKHAVLVDVLAIALGFVLRALAGGAAIPVALSPWLVVCTLGVALFLGFHKRRHELCSPAGGGTAHRPILAEYPPAFLDQMITATLATTLIAYCLWVVSHPTGPAMLATIPFVVYGLARYSLLAARPAAAGQPDEVMMADVPFLINLAGWVATVLGLLYVYPWLGR